MATQEYTETDYHAFKDPELGAKDYQQYLSDNIQAYDERIVKRGSLSNRPAAEKSGRIYISTDSGEQTVYLDTGNAWVAIAGTQMGNQTIRVNEVHADDGTATDPSYTFDSDTDTGMYSPAAGSLRFSTNGGFALEITDGQRVDAQARGRIKHSAASFVSDSTFAAEPGLIVVPDSENQRGSAVHLVPSSDPSGSGVDSDKADIHWMTREGEIVARVGAHENHNHFSIYTRDGTAYDGSLGGHEKRLDIEGGAPSSTHVKWQNIYRHRHDSRGTGVDHRHEYHVDAGQVARQLYYQAGTSLDLHAEHGYYPGTDEYKFRVDSAAGTLSDVLAFNETGATLTAETADTLTLVRSGSGQARLVVESGDGGQSYVYRHDASDYLGVYDATGAQDVARFKDGGVVEIPNGKLDMAVNPIRNATPLTYAGSAVIDIDDDNTSSSSTLDITHDGQAETLFTVNESGVVEIPNGNLDLGGNEIVTVREIKADSAYDFPDIHTPGSGTGQWAVWDASAGNRIIAFREGGEVAVLNGNLKVATGNDIIDSGGDGRVEIRSSKTTIGSPGGGSGRIALHDHSAGVDKLRVQEGGAVEVVNKPLKAIATGQTDPGHGGSTAEAPLHLTASDPDGIAALIQPPGDPDVSATDKAGLLWFTRDGEQVAKFDARESSTAWVVQTRTGSFDGTFGTMADRFKLEAGKVSDDQTFAHFTSVRGLNVRGTSHSASVRIDLQASAGADTMYRFREGGTVMSSLRYHTADDDLKLWLDPGDETGLNNVLTINGDGTIAGHDSSRVGTAHEQPNAHFPMSEIADGDHVAMPVHVPAGSEIKVWAWGVQDDSQSAPTGLTVELFDETGAVSVSSENTKRTTGTPIVSDAAGTTASDYTLRIDNATGGTVNAGGFFAYTVE